MCSNVSKSQCKGVLKTQWVAKQSILQFFYVQDPFSPFITDTDSVKLCYVCNETSVITSILYFGRTGSFKEKFLPLTTILFNVTPAKIFLHPAPSGEHQATLSEKYLPSLQFHFLSRFSIRFQEEPQQSQKITTPPQPAMGWKNHRVTLS